MLQDYDVPYLWMLLVEAAASAVVAAAEAGAAATASAAVAEADAAVAGTDAAVDESFDCYPFERVSVCFEYVRLLDFEPSSAAAIWSKRTHRRIEARI